MLQSFLPLTAVPLYLAVTGCVEGSSLSPRVMRWSEDTLLIDLSPTFRYWQQKANESEMRFEDFIAQILPTSARGVLSNHPWQAVLHLKTFSTRGQGQAQLLHLSSHFGKALTRRLDWATWQETCQEIAEHFVGKNISASTSAKRTSLLRSLRLFLQTVQKMQLATPAHLKEAQSLSSRRRFVAQLATLWEWTWIQNEERLVDGFPWLSVKHQETPRVTRLLNHPVRAWDHIEPFLCEDFQRICNLACWTSSERVVSLEWVLSFSHSPSLTIPVLFRHPHSLHREAAGHHKTALLQAFHSWQSTLNKRLKQSAFKADTLYLEHDAICEWTLTVTERLTLPVQMRSLFEDDLASPAARLRDLENTLPLNLEEFALNPDWTANGSWSVKKSTSHDPQPEAMGDSFSSLSAQHNLRPLFIQHQPTPLPNSANNSRKLFFQERVMTKWWEDTSHGSRDYFLKVSDNSTLQWVFSESGGSQLFLHGIYG